MSRDDANTPTLMNPDSEDKRRRGGESCVPLHVHWEDRVLNQQRLLPESINKH